MAQHKQRKRLPKVGDILTGKYQGKQFKATVVGIRKSESRTHVAVKVLGVEYGSLSAAAKSITGYWVNGYVFWGLESKSG